MRDSNHLPDEVRRTTRQFGATLAAIGRVILGVLLFPFRMLFFPLRGLGLFHNTGVDLHEVPVGLTFGARLKYNAARTWHRVRRSLSYVLSTPTRLFWRLRRAQPRDLIFILPAVLMIGLFGFVAFQVMFRSAVIEKRYRQGIQAALNDNDFQLAKTYFGRLLNEGELTSPEKYQWAIVLAETGEPERAEELINQLAPDSEPAGFPLAHRLRALNLANNLNNSKDQNVLRKLRWHLRASKDNSPEISQAWAKYYLVTENIPEAVKELEKSAAENPGQYLMIANILKAQGNQRQRRQVLEQAERAYRSRLDQDPLDHSNRIMLANTLVQQESFDEAEAVLAQGNRLQPDDLIRHSLADFYVMQYDRAAKAQVGIDVQLNLLVQAINLAPRHGPIYQRMVRLYLHAKSSGGDLASVRQKLQDVVTGDHPTPMAHFALSNVLWQEGKRDQAQFHLERAYAMDNGILVVLNNLAFVLSDSKEPDLERALALAKSAVEGDPRNGHYRETYGSVLLKLKRYTEATAELELALNSLEITNKQAVHQKLAMAYGELGMDELAARHRKE